MSNVSSWPLPESSSRFITPIFIVNQLRSNIVSRGLFPTAFGYYQKASGHQVSRSHHDDHLLILCSEGKGHFQSENIEFTITANDILFIPKGTKHKYLADKTEPWTIYWCHFEGHLFQQFMDHIGINEHNPVLKVTDISDFKSEFTQLLSLPKHGLELNAFIVAANICKKLLSLCCLQKHQFQTEKKAFRLDNVNAYLSENITENLTLDEMAQYHSLSKFHFSKKFKQVFGATPMKHFLSMKIQHACIQLDTTNLTIKAIAESIGIDDPYYFSRLFKKVMGMSPKQYRNTSH